MINLSIMTNFTLLNIFCKYLNSKPNYSFNSPQSTILTSPLGLS